MTDRRSRCLTIGLAAVAGITYDVRSPGVPPVEAVHGIGGPDLRWRRTWPLPRLRRGSSACWRRRPRHRFGPGSTTSAARSSTRWSLQAAAQPCPCRPERVDQMLSGGEASPFEIAAAQALAARWAGVPSRVAYGFDGGDVVGDRRHVRLHHSVFFVEVHVGEHGWLPVIGSVRKARPCR